MEREVSPDTKGHVLTATVPATLQTLSPHLISPPQLTLWTERIKVLKEPQTIRRGASWREWGLIQALLDGKGLDKEEKGKAAQG